MEIRCEACKHLGAPGSIEPGGAGFVVRCASCGHAMSARLGSPSEPRREPEVNASRRTATAAARGEGEAEDRERAALMERLVPRPGGAARCPKCVGPIEWSEEACAQCGLGLDRATSYRPGEAPWELDEAPDRASWEQAELIWGSISEAWGAEQAERFADYVEERDLHEFAVRRLRRLLVERPDDSHALAAIERSGRALSKRAAIAAGRVRAGTRVAEIERRRLRRRILGAGGAALGILLIVAIALFSRIV